MKDFPPELKKGAGTYALVMRLARGTVIPVGKLDPTLFAAGYYVYTGSAFGPGGLAARVGRHLRPSKKCHWHIDYLRRFAAVDEIWYTIHPERHECGWATIFQKARGARIICPGFGASDCHCNTHLFYFKSKPGIRTYRRKFETPVFCKGISA